MAKLTERTRLEWLKLARKAIDGGAEVSTAILSVHPGVLQRQIILDLISAQIFMRREGVLPTKEFQKTDESNNLVLYFDKVSSQSDRLKLLDDAITHAEINILNGKYITFIERLQRRWLRHNNRPSKEWRLYELDAEERQRVDGVIRRWEEHVTPVAERWWKRRGFGIRWPEKSSDPCQIYKLETAEA